MSIKPFLLLSGTLLLVSCNGTPANTRAVAKDNNVASSAFPEAQRPVSAITSDRWASEAERDRVDEANKVMDIAGVNAGMSIADIGAGEGYYTIRLAARVGKEGRVLAQDIFPKVRQKLAERALRERLDNVSVMLGAPADPKLPENSFDRVFMIHMYHEIATPYEFLWRLRPSLLPGGQVVVVDADRPTGAHGIPPTLLECEMASVGYKKVDQHPLPTAGIFLMRFTVSGDRPTPEAIKACAI
ncbi:MAG: class I SAM-dependent methyltransferase [Pseudomonadota bacterium]